MNTTRFIAEFVRAVFSVEAWMLLMFIFSLFGMIELIGISRLLQRILEQLESRLSPTKEEDDPRMWDKRLE